MTGLEYHSRPQLRRPVMVTAFQGWSDAGEAATSSITFLRTLWNATLFATFDAEAFYDFQAHRPLVKINEDGIREITWPTTDVAYASVPGADRDVILLLGIEPSMRWPTFSKLIIDVARTSGVELVVGLGALLAGRPHTRPIRVTARRRHPSFRRSTGSRRRGTRVPQASPVSWPTRVAARRSTLSRCGLGSHTTSRAGPHRRPPWRCSSDCPRSSSCPSTCRISSSGRAPTTRA